MPIFSYTCPSCKHQFDRISHKFATEEDSYPCPECGYIAARDEFELPAKRAGYHGIQQ